jgi:hypothetical protein
MLHGGLRDTRGFSGGSPATKSSHALGDDASAYPHGSCGLAVSRHPEVSNWVTRLAKSAALRYYWLRISPNLASGEAAADRLGRTSQGR